MQVSVESTSTLERKMTVQVPADKVASEVSSRLKKVGQTARLDGFRKGKIPFSVVRKRFGGQVRREVLGDLIESSYRDALIEQKLNPAGQPSIDPTSMEEGKDLEYVATFEVFPEVSIKKLDGLKMETQSATVGASDVDTMIETLRKQRADWVDSDKAVNRDERITIDFVGTLDGEEFEGGKADDYPVVVGAGQLLPDLENGLEGMKSGDEKSIEVVFPDDYQAKDLAGKTATFAVTAKKVEVQELPEVDADFINEFGVEDGTIEKFRESVQENMERELNERLSGKRRQVALDAFWDANVFELPKALVEQETQAMLEDTGRRMGVTDPAQLPPADMYTEQAKRHVGLRLLINEVITSQELTVDSAQVDEKLASVTGSYEQSDEVIKQYRSNPQVMQQIEAMVMEEQVVSLLIDKADVTDKELSFDEAMNG
ncbi:MAG: trigger factor [Gammaproteobacteria bacterium]